MKVGLPNIFIPKLLVFKVYTVSIKNPSLIQASGTLNEICRRIHIIKLLCPSRTEIKKV